MGLLARLAVMVLLSCLFRARSFLVAHRRWSASSVTSRAATTLSCPSTDTIYALSSGKASHSGVAVVRVSGPRAWPLLETLCAEKKQPLAIKPRFATLKSLYCPKTQEKLDRTLVLWFPGPHSFTGEDVVELHVHGSRAVLSGLFSAMESVERVRPAEAGEFTRRAFDNGKMDLTEVEGLADLLVADTAVQRKQALRQMEGHMRKTYEQWRETLMKCLAHTEAVIDFGDDDREGDINDHAMDALLPIVRDLHAELLRHLRDGRKGEIIREGVQVALIGQPNAGKSSLMNALARRPAAIVSPIAGTTRDIVEVRMDIGGVSCIVRDTAGLRKETNDPIEMEGIQRAKDAFRQAHVRIFVVDVSNEKSIEEAAQLYRDVKLLLKDNDESGDENSGISSSLMVALNKVDIVQDAQTLEQRRALWARLVGEDGAHDPILSLSCASGLGLDTLEGDVESLIQEKLQQGTDDSLNGEGAIITRERHRQHVRQCVEHLEAFLFRSLPMDLAAEEIRLAMQELGKVTGRVDVEELLDIIFRDFCIGK